ncbi:MAG: CofD-like protein [Berkelbacteria bacterium GW2011_GWA1_39_10]|uniref:Putative gluconeogenesis factor n=1 Tax=Berkelbacteria bacterium GW2011_GWA1_39_10 TaxID=1618332 RepID=A0A0G0LJ07_9BACT|nr:MAG: CofD-like protein [Berkelbacteria bacterium GW2011_GWA1_39_10]
MARIRDQKTVVIGGGTGLANLLRGLKNHTEKLTAVVTMADDGRSTGQLRRDFNILPPGDVRNCIVALADEELLYHKLLTYRFPHGRGLKGHNLGNLLLVALGDITGSFKKAIQELSRILNIKGQVLPSTYDDVIISAELANGRSIWGESLITTAGHRSPIRKVKLHPESATANKDAVKAIEKADVIIVGPGSLYTSIIPNFLLKEICRAVASSRAKKIFVCNVSTERGETENYTVKDHIDVLIKHSDPQIFDVCLVNSKILLKTSGKRLGEVKNITTGEKKIDRFDIVQADLIDETNPLYHDSEKSVKTLIKILES